MKIKNYIMTINLQRMNNPRMNLKAVKKKNMSSPKAPVIKKRAKNVIINIKLLKKLKPKIIHSNAIVVKPTMKQ